MKPNLIAASMALAMLLALGGCSNTGETGTISPNPSATNSDINGGLPNNAGGTANNNNGTVSDHNGTGTTGGTGTAGTGTAGTGTAGTGTAGTGTAGTGTAGTGTAGGDTARYGDYYAGRNGNVNTGNGALHDAGDAMRDAAHDVGRAARDIF